LANYLKLIFGLRIARGAEITLNAVRLTSKVDPTERFLFRMKGGVDVTGNPKEDRKGKGSVDAYVKHVYVQSVMIDPERMFSGWINCDDLTPTTSRNELVKDNYFDDFLDHAKEYVTWFPRREEEMSHEEIVIGNELARLLKNWLRDMKLFPEGRITLVTGSELTKTALGSRVRTSKEEVQAPTTGVPESDVPEYVKIHSATKSAKRIRRTSRTDYGVIWIDQDWGDDREPLFFVPPNMIIRNRTNSLYRFAIRKKPSLGPKWLRLLPFLARVAVSVNKESKEWTRERCNIWEDKAMRYFLSQKGELHTPLTH